MLTLLLLERGLRETHPYPWVRKHDPPVLLVWIGRGVRNAPPYIC
jgi:hypothetical protein